MRHTILVGHASPESGNRDVEIEVEIKDRNGRPALSICGAVWLANRRDWASGGQNLDHIKQGIATYLVPESVVDRLIAIWERWHLNDMRAGCEHQRANWDVTRRVEVVEYGITTEAYTLRNKTRSQLTEAALKGPDEVAHLLASLSPTARALAELEDWYKERYELPAAASPLAGCFEMRNRGVQAIGWVHQHKHPEGVLAKPCEVCGYKYGTSWLFEPMPDEIVNELRAIIEQYAGGK